MEEVRSFLFFAYDSEGLQFLIQDNDLDKLLDEDNLEETLLDNEEMLDEDNFEDEELCVDDEELEKASSPWNLRSIVMYILMWQFVFGISNAGILALLVFLCSFLKLITTNGMFDDFPKTLKSAYKVAGISFNSFIQYIVCPACNSVFDYDFEVWYKMVIKFQTVVNM